MDFNSLRKEINSKNASVKELISDFFLKIDIKVQQNVFNWACAIGNSNLVLKMLRSHTVLRSV